MNAPIIFTFLAIVLSYTSSFAQQDSINLIPNPSFEDINICSKYKETCCPEAWRSSTLKAFYYFNDEKAVNSTNRAKEGHQYVSICMHNAKRDFDRGFLQVPLLCELEAGKSYELSFYYKTPFRMLNQFGILFKDTLLIQLKNDHLEGIQASILLKNKNFIRANQWIQVKEIYKAKGGEKVMMIGNFSRDQHTKVIQLVKEKKGKYDNTASRTYYLFDDFKLSPLDTISHCDLEKNKNLIYGDNVRHSIPSEKIKPVEIVEEPLKKQTEFLVIESDSILISETFELPNILFETNSDQLLSVSYPSLRKLGNYLLFNRSYNLSIIGHTDDQGSHSFNQTLSERRAKAVHDYLLQQGLKINRLSFAGKGESEPIDTNKTEVGRAKNRRVEFSLIKI